MSVYDFATEMFKMFWPFAILGFIGLSLVTIDCIKWLGRRIGGK